MLIQGIDFGPKADLADVIRRRMAGHLDVQDDPNDPTLHAWLERVYQRLRAEGEHEALGAAYASLIADESPLVREAVAHFLRGWPDDPSAAVAARRALMDHRALYSGFPDTLGGSPAGLEGELLGAVGKTLSGPDDPLLSELRSAARREQMLGPCLPALATHDPLFLTREAASLAQASPYWIRTFLGVLDQGQLPMATRWIAPRSDVVGRIARAGVVPNEVLESAIEEGVSNRAERTALSLIATTPGPVGDYWAEDSTGLALDVLRRRCLEPGGADGGVLTAFGAVDPGFAARTLGRILRATPGALGPLLAWSSRHGLEMGETTRRIKSLGLHSRELFLAVATVNVDRTKLADVESAWLAA